MPKEVLKSGWTRSAPSGKAIGGCMLLLNDIMIYWLGGNETNLKEDTREQGREIQRFVCVHAGGAADRKVNMNVLFQYNIIYVIFY